ncbi:transposase [Streptomyces sp. RPA4-5]|uniref:transposase n=1 Tax=Streptomyces sp. RPA4-5 TaxID=2721245 RepID=UPI0032B3B3D0
MLGTKRLEMLGPRHVPLFLADVARNSSAATAKMLTAAGVTPRMLIALCGVSPIERSSGSRQYRRLNRGGDRQANAAFHRVVQTRLRFDTRTQEYYERRIKQGKTRREIVRCLKRYAAREVFHLVKAIQP